MRPRDLSLLMLAAGGKPPRQRARDQKADRAGFELRQQLLDRLAQLDPDADELEASLMRVIEELGPPSGPVRAIAANVRDEMRSAYEDPSIVEHLIRDAVQADATKREKTP